MARRLIIVAAAALLLALPAPAGAASPLAGTHWTVQKIGKHVMPAGFGAELHFQARRRWTGSDDCNNLGGRYRLRSRGSRLRFVDMRSTARACDYPPGAVPPSFSGALVATRHYRLSKGRLVLLGARGRMLARLTRLH